MKKWEKLYILLWSDRWNHFDYGHTLIMEAEEVETEDYNSAQLDQSYDNEKVFNGSDWAQSKVSSQSSDVPELTPYNFEEKLPEDYTEPEQECYMTTGARRSRRRP